MRNALVSVASVASVALLVAAGCSSASADAAGDDTGNGEDEVRTAECPASFTLDLDKPEIYKRTPAKYYDGSSLASSERGRVETAMTQARKFKKQTLSFNLTQKANAKCSYASSMSNAASAPRAQLRGTAAKPIIDVTFGAFRYYSFPKSYATSGFTFDKNAKAGVFSQVSASGSFSDGASIIVKIGNSKITGGQAINVPPTGPIPGSGSIADAVAELESEEVLPGPGRHDDYAVTGTSAIAMVKSYIKAKYADDSELGDEYTFKENGPGLEGDVQVAGTLTKEVAVSESIGSIQNWYDNQDEPTSHMTKVKAAFAKLTAAGAQFGYDGFEQNACAAPTSFLLVIDSANKHVYGVDLNPCEE